MHITCCATEDTDCLNNISYLFQQQEEGESSTYDTSSADPARVKCGVEWVKSAQELFTPWNADKHLGFRRKGEE